MVALFIVTALLRLTPYFIHINPELNINAPLAQFLFKWILGFEKSYYFSITAASILVFIQALQLNYITSRHGILYKDTMLPGLLYVIINSLYVRSEERR